MTRTRLSTTRLLALALVAVLGVLVHGDRTRAQSAADETGIDPLAVLDLQVKPVALIVLDSSNSMLFPLDANYYLASDDPNARMVLAKKALRDTITANQGKVRFKLAKYNDTDNGVFAATNFNNLETASDPQPGYLYVTTDPNGNLFNTTATGDRWFKDTLAVWDTNGDPVYVDPSADPPVQQTQTYYYMASLTYLNGQTLNAAGSVTAAGTPVVPPARPQIKVSNGTTTVTYTFVGVRWAKTLGCSATGFDQLTSVASCGTVDQITGIGPYLGREVQISSTGALDTAATHGIRSAASTPIGATLDGIKTWFDGTADGTRAESPRPRTFVIVLTDGDDNCTSGGAAGAAAAAQRLYNYSATDLKNRVETLVIAFGPQASQDNANKIAYAGAGYQSTDNWATTPTADQLAVGCNGGPCRKAFIASDQAALKKALQDALDQGTSTGQFAASPTTADTVWEYGWDANVNPWKPFERYHAFVSLVFQPTFDASDFSGKFTAWGYGATGPVAKWEAGAILNDPTAYDGGTAAPGLYFTTATFSTLRGSNTLATSLIKRRIYTSSSNGVFTSSADQLPVALWPPSRSVAPAGTDHDSNGAATGYFDAALGIAGMSFTDLQAAPIVACGGVTSASQGAGHPCLSATYQLARARREARETILAHMAGAVVVGRCGTSAPYAFGTAPCDGLTAASVNSATAVDTGIVYAKRWPVAESTNATPAVVGPPPEVLPKSYQTAYMTLRADLRNPDKVSDQTVWADATVKPVMTVVYLATNQMLHAFRAGPCPNKAAADPYRCSDGTVNSGGEELWAFVPYDQLGKLRMRVGVQARKPHNYMMGASLRVADVYDPSTSTWRTLLFAGRGPGGKYITALDVTNPGRATLPALSSSINPPLVMWNRGNPDTVDGVVGGTWNHDSTDGAAYAKMGQTWSVPAVVKVDPANNKTTRRSGGVTFVAYAGSGYSDVASEGSTLFGLDALNGDVVGYYDVGDGANTWYDENAIVASPAALQPAMYSTEVFVHPSDAQATRIYVGDTHGRLWAFPPKGGTAFTPLGGAPFAALGASQPIANGVALLNYSTDGTVRPHVYVETGNDTRVAPPGDVPPFAATPPFKMYGFRDEDATSDPDGSDGVSGLARVLFTKPFKNDPPPGFRGTVQPVAAFNAARQGRVFFAGTQFTPAGTECISSYDSILYMLSAKNGSPAYDVNDGTTDDSYVVYENQIINQLDIVRVPPESGRLNVSRAMGTNGAAPKPVSPPANSRVAPAIRSDVYWTDVKMSSSVCR